MSDIVLATLLTVPIIAALLIFIWWIEGGRKE